MHRLKLVVIKSVPDIHNPRYTEYNALDPERLYSEREGLNALYSTYFEL